jgi:hypothetical protein
MAAQIDHAEQYPKRSRCDDRSGGYTKISTHESPNSMDDPEGQPRGHDLEKDAESMVPHAYMGLFEAGASWKPEACGIQSTSGLGVRTIYGTLSPENWLRSSALANGGA